MKDTSKSLRQMANKREAFAELLAYQVLESSLNQHIDIQSLCLYIGFSIKYAMAQKRK